MQEHEIDKEFASLCPDLTPEEYRLLEQSILDDGCRDPITVWHGKIIDGHNRYEICHKHERPFKTRTLNLPDRDAAMAWILRNQCGRRNLTESQRAILAAKLANLSRGDNQHTKEDAHVCATSQADAADEFGVGRRTVQQAAKVIEDGAVSLQRAVQDGNVAVSAAAVIADLPKAEQAKIVAKGPEAVAKKVKQIKEKKPKPDKRLEFDTAQMNKDLARERKNGAVKKQWQDKTVLDAIGQFAKQIDAAHGGLVALFDQCQAEAGGSDADVSRAKRAAGNLKAKAHELLHGVTTAFRMWRPRK